MDSPITLRSLSFGSGVEIVFDILGTEGVDLLPFLGIDVVGNDELCQKTAFPDIARARR